MKAMDVVRNIMRNKTLMKDLSVAFSFMSGAAAGAALAIRLFEREYALLAEQEIAEARRYFMLRYKDKGYETPEEAAKTLGVDVTPDVAEGLSKEDIETFREAERLVVDYQSAYANPGHPRVVREEPREPEEKLERQRQREDVFDRAFTTDVSEEDKKDRDPEFAYIISMEEFRENEPEHEQSTLTYFQGDDVLMEEGDQIVDDVDDIIGSEALLKFGYGSADANVVYVRNERLETDFEILRHTGEYAQMVHGLKHDSRPAIRRMREDRE